MKKIKLSLIVLVLLFTILTFLFVFSIFKNYDYINLKLNNNIIFQSRIIVISLLLVLTILDILVFFYYLNSKKYFNDVFSNLKKIDKENKEEKINSNFNSFEAFFKSFKSFLVNEEKIYLDDDIIRVFLSYIIVCNIIILQGQPGTGKTSLSIAFSKYFNIKQNIIPVQPVWKDKSGLLGFYNDFTKKYNETEFLKLIYKALYSKKIYPIVLDEANISRVEYYFSDFLSLLEFEEEKREIELMPFKLKSYPKLIKDGKIKISNNLRFLLTINNDDQTFKISDKVYDRSGVVEINDIKLKYSYEKLPRMNFTFEDMILEFDNKEFFLDKYYQDEISKIEQYFYDNYLISYGNRTLNKFHRFLKAYYLLGGNILDGIDEFLSKYLILKAINLYKYRTKENKDIILSFLSQVFDGKLKKCKMMIENI